MKMTTASALGMVAATLACSTACATPAEYAQQMLKLATDRGCMACHTLEAAPRRADGLPPIAPSWLDVARKYRDDPQAHQRLLRTVLEGSNPQARHWVGKVSNMAMPPNAGAVNEADARALVNWLLVLTP
jgi:cytochrome c